MTVAPEPKNQTSQLRRTGPRPLGLHMAIEGWILQMSFAGLMASSDAWPLSSLLQAGGLLKESLQGPLAIVAAEAAAQNPRHEESAPRGPGGATLQPTLFINAVAREAHARMEDFVRGVSAYQAHPFRREFAPPPPVWRCGVATLIDYGGPEGAPAVLFVPSLINRAYILDLAQDRSLVRAAAAGGLRVFLLDWGEPGDAERSFAIEDYIDGVLIPALEQVKSRTSQTPRVVGYCIGGTLAVASAVLRPDLVSGLALLAAPWDFHKGTEASRAFLDLSRPMIEGLLGAHGCAPADLLQALFASLDPTLVGRKFRRYAVLDPSAEQARRFVALEDWLNDGVPLARPVAEEVFFRWYGLDDPANGRWLVRGIAIDPRRIVCPTLAFIPMRDRIVPPQSAGALAEAIANARAVTVDLGHIGMVSASRAPKQVFEPLIAWLRSPPRP